MIKALKLNSAIWVFGLGLLFFIGSEMVKESNEVLYNWLLSLSGIGLILAAILFLWPLFRAKKVDPDGKVVKLTPLGDQPEEALPDIEEPLNGDKTL